MRATSAHQHERESRHKSASACHHADLNVREKFLRIGVENALPRPTWGEQQPAGNPPEEPTMSPQIHLDSIEKKIGQTLRKVVAGYFLSLDGVAEAPNRFITAWDDETDASGANLSATQDAVVLGRRSYDEWAEFWPGSEIEPFASFINAVLKYVATSTPLEREWTNARVIDGGLVDFVRHLKGRPGGDIGVHGSISVTRTLLAADVVDELRLVIAPTIVGSGQRLFDGLPPIRLETIRSSASRSGHLLVDYRVVC
jgi:dihydrofolate reductase